MKSEDNDLGPFQTPLAGKLSVEKKDSSNTPYLSQPKRCCNCKQSKCLKLYCECYAAGVYCTSSCNCVECWNNPNFEEQRKEAIQATLEKNPTAFQPKISNSNYVESKKSANFGKHSRGCACKKSGCMKKYCECFQAGIPCSDICKCADCHNTKEYYDNNKRKGAAAGTLDVIKQEEIPDSNSFFFKFLLTANDSDAAIQNAIKLNKKTQAIDTQYIETLYKKLISILEMKVPDVCKNEDLISQIKSALPKNIACTENASTSGQQQPKIEKSQSPMQDESKEQQESPQQKQQDLTMKAEGQESDDLACDEGELIGAAEELKHASQDGNKTVNGESQSIVAEDDEAKKFSLYKIKRKAIINEFIQALRTLDE